jgi:hypothetical protein
MFKVVGWGWGKMFTMKSEEVVRPSAVSDDDVLTADQRICKRWLFTIPQISTNLTYCFLQDIIGWVITVFFFFFQDGF